MGVIEVSETYGDEQEGGSVGFTSVRPCNCMEMKQSAFVNCRPGADDEGARLCICRTQVMQMVSECSSRFLKDSHFEELIVWSTVILRLLFNRNVNTLQTTGVGVGGTSGNDDASVDAASLLSM